MNIDFYSDGNTWFRITGGTLRVLLIQLSVSEVLKTAILATIGGVASFIVSIGLKWMLRWLSRNKKWPKGSSF
jgi:hypothetical protein